MNIITQVASQPAPVPFCRLTLPHQFRVSAHSLPDFLIISIECSSYNVSAFTVDREFIKEDHLFDLPVLPFEGIEKVYSPEEHGLHIAVGHVRVNKVRAQKYYQAKELGYQLVSFVSSKAVTWPGLVHGENCKIGTNATINPFAQLGNNVRVGMAAMSDTTRLSKTMSP